MSLNDPTPGVDSVRSVSGQGLGVVPLLLSSPSEAFRLLAADPRWVGPFVLFLVFMALGGWIRMPQDTVLQEETLIATMERMGVGGAELDEALARMPDPDNLLPRDIALHLVQLVAATAAIGFLGVLVFWVIARLVGPQPGFRRAAAVYWTAYLAAGFGYLVTALIVRATDSVEVALSPAALLPGVEWGSVPYLFLDLFNVFSLCTLFLLAVGARWVFGTSRGTGWVAAGVFWGFASLLSFGLGVLGAFVSGRL